MEELEALAHRTATEFNQIYNGSKGTQDLVYTIILPVTGVGNYPGVLSNGIYEVYAVENPASAAKAAFSFCKSSLALAQVAKSDLSPAITLSFSIAALEYSAIVAWQLLKVELIIVFSAVVKLLLSVTTTLASSTWASILFLI